MSPACLRFRAGLHDLVVADPEALAHAASCEPCAALAARVERAAGAVADLKGLSAPVSLDGLVVAALEAGVREERAVRAVQGLEREPLPEPLEEAVETEAEIAAELERTELAAGFDTERQPVPSVLERLVSEELAQPDRAVVERFVFSLPRQKAPSELEARVHADLVEPAATPAPITAPRLLGRRLTLVGSTLAAGLLVTLLFRPFFTITDPDQGRPFRVEPATADDLAALDPFTKGLIENVAGGMLAARDL
jgi:hypothetical protein